MVLGRYVVIRLARRTQGAERHMRTYVVLEADEEVHHKVAPRHAQQRVGGAVGAQDVGDGPVLCANNNVHACRGEES